MEFKIVGLSYEEADYIEEMLIKHNQEQKKFLQDTPFISINKGIKDENNNLIGGVLCYSVMWKIFYIDTLWVDKKFRNKGIASFLLKEAENEGKKLGCKIAHLDSFEFQAKDFYIKNGYKVFGVLEDCPEGFSEYFLYKRF